MEPNPNMLFLQLRIKCLNCSLPRRFINLFLFFMFVITKYQGHILYLILRSPESGLLGLDLSVKFQDYIIELNYWVKFQGPITG